MNAPEYILIDGIASIIDRVKTDLLLPVLDFKYGYLSELKVYLQQVSQDDPSKKYPLIWVRYPFTIDHGGRQASFYGKTSNLTVFIIAESNKDRTAERRMTEVFKPVIYPIYRSFMRMLNDSTSVGIAYEVDRSYRTTDRFYWGEEQQKEIDDIIDCMEISNLEITIHNNLNLCQ